jgi:hypothetical protein
VSTIGLVLLAVLPAAPLPDVPAPPPDISCNVYNTLATGIERGWRLKISGPQDRKWEVRFESGIPSERRLVASGTYELTDGLAVFTATNEQAEVARFALNYGFSGGRVFFNAFLPLSETELRYRRQEFRKLNGQWQLSEELLLSLPRIAPDEDRWEVRLTGERRRYNDTGKMTVEKIEKTITYQKALQRGSIYYWRQPRGDDGGFPIPQQLHVVEKHLEAYPTYLEHQVGPGLRGFGSGLPSDFPLGR